VRAEYSDTVALCTCEAARVELTVAGMKSADVKIKRAQIDSLEQKAIAYMYRKDDPGVDSMANYANTALEESKRIGYAHGIAVALACQAFVIDKQANDFPRSEKLARESMEWFVRTNDQCYITLAHYTLGFSLFAQSRFDEAIHHFEQGRQLALQSGNRLEEVSMLSLIGEAYRERGDYERAFDIIRKCIQLAEDIHNPQLVSVQYLTLAGLFMQIEDYGAAEKNFRIAFGNDKPEQTDPWSLMVYSELLTRQHKYDSALYYYARMDSARLGTAMMRTFLVSKGEYYLLRKEYATALPYFLKSLFYQRQLNDRNQVMRCLQDLYRTYERLGQDDSAFRYAREGLALAQQTDARQNIREGYLMFSTLYDKRKQTDSAYSYYRRYIAIKDSVLNDQMKGKFASYGFEEKIKWLKQEKQLSDVCLREEMMTKNILLGGIIVLVLFGFIYVWNIRLKRKNEAHRRQRAENELEIQRLEGERAKAALQQRTKELEIQALRSQMNPHFIFNCLNAINRFILSHETEAASDYLTKFSRLMRMIMNHSRHSLITLTEEMEILQLYLNMERLRFKNAFDYEIVVDEGIDADDIRIPPLLLQPFVENAIWHGLMHKEERGFLSIRMLADEHTLTCIIRDNGIGRKRAAQLKSKSVEKHKSMGLQITAERMALLTGSGEPGHFFRIEDLYDIDGNAAGTEVVLTIKINNTGGEAVGGLTRANQWVS
jgi:tetratricopeptide (TPR) repeat protein